MTISTNFVPGALITLSLLATEAAHARPKLVCDQPIVADYGQFFALPGRAGDTTQVYRWVWPSRADKVWETSGWPDCDGYLSEDGEYLVVGDGRHGSIDRDYAWDQVMLRFYHRDRLLRAVPLREVLSDPRKIAWNDGRNVWATSMGFIGAHRFALDTADDRRLIYDVTSGALAETTWSNDYNQYYPNREERRGNGKPRMPPPDIQPPDRSGWPIVDADHPVRSRNRRFFALPAAERTVTQVFRSLGRGRAEKLWEKAGWDDATYISDDGEHLVTGYPGRNLLDRKYTSETTLLTFFRRGTLVRAVPVRAVIFHVENLWEWPDGYEWGEYRGFVSARRFAVDTVEDRRVFYDVTTGVPVDGQPTFVKRFRARFANVSEPTR